MVRGRSHWMPRLPWLVGWLALMLLIVATGVRSRPLPQGEDDALLSEWTERRVASEITPDGHFETTIRRPTGPPTIALPQTDLQGRAGSVACSTCHSVRPPNPANRVPADLDQFHQNMSLAHGELACYACHNPDDADTLRLADATPVEYADVMSLCSQCHGPQARDYQHGAHGGMNGYWDLSRGPRTRNNCIDCHDPHVPKFPTMLPTFKPRDRFLRPHSGEGLHFQPVESEADGE